MRGKGSADNITAAAAGQGRLKGGIAVFNSVEAALSDSLCAARRGLVEYAAFRVCPENGRKDSLCLHTVMQYAPF